jgi:copper(I)-binding protein
MPTGLRVFFVALLFLGSHAVHAADGVQVTGAWARATAPGQPVAGIYLNIMSDSDARLTAVETPIAKEAQLHQMRMEGGTMRMRQVEAIDLPAGKTIALEPGDYHVMALGLKRPLKPGEQVPLRLTVVDVKGAKRTITTSVQVKNLDGSDPHEHH